MNKDKANSINYHFLFDLFVMLDVGNSLIEANFNPMTKLKE